MGVQPPPGPLVEKLHRIKVGEPGPPARASNAHVRFSKPRAEVQQRSV